VCVFAHACMRVCSLIYSVSLFLPSNLSFYLSKYTLMATQINSQVHLILDQSSAIFGRERGHSINCFG